MHINSGILLLLPSFSRHKFWPFCSLLCFLFICHILNFSFLSHIHSQITISPLYKTVPESSLKLSQSPHWNLWTWSQSSLCLFDILNTLPFFLPRFLTCQPHLPRPPPFALQIFVLFGFLNDCFVLFIHLHSVMDIVSSYYFLYCSYLLSFLAFPFSTTFW